MRQTRLTKRRNATHPTHLVLAVYVATRGPRPTMTFRAAVPRRGTAASLPAPVWMRTPTPLMRHRWRARTSGRWLAFDGFCRDLDGPRARRVDEWTVPTTHAVSSAPGRRQCPLRRGPSCADLCIFGGTGRDGSCGFRFQAHGMASGFSSGPLRGYRVRRAHLTYPLGPSGPISSLRARNRKLEITSPATLLQRKTKTKG